MDIIIPYLAEKSKYIFKKSEKYEKNGTGGSLTESRLMIFRVLFEISPAEERRRGRYLHKHRSPGKRLR